METFFSRFVWIVRMKALGLHYESVHVHNRKMVAVLNFE